MSYNDAFIEAGFKAVIDLIEANDAMSKKDRDSAITLILKHKQRTLESDAMSAELDKNSSQGQTDIIARETLNLRTAIEGEGIGKHLALVISNSFESIMRAGFGKITARG